MSLTLKNDTKSEYFSIVDAGGAIICSERLTAGATLHTANPTIVHDANQNQYLDQLNSTAVVDIPLPDVGTALLAGEIYAWEGQNVMVRQSHNRTADDPDTVPALFSVYREATDEMLWIPNEQVLVGDDRIFDGQKYESLQGHQTQEGWEPPAVPALWQLVVGPGDEWPDWVQPGSTNPYRMAAQVAHVDKHWISNHDANVWEPGTVGTDNLWLEAI